MDRPAVSIICATFNRGNYISEAIDSVLAQTFGSWEIIIIDDNSQDQTEQIVSSYIEKDARVKYVKNMERQGVGRARNIGISHAEGKYIAILDSDDYWCDKQKLQMQVDFMERHPEYALISVDAMVVDGSGKEIGSICNHCTDKKLRNNILIKNKIVHSGILFRKDMYEAVGRYDEKLAVGEDYDLWLKLGKIGKFENIDHKMVAYRKHNSGQESTARIHRSLKHNIEVIGRYKDHYPNYFFANFRRQLRYFLAKLLFKENK